MTRSAAARLIALEVYSVRKHRLVYVLITIAIVFSVSGCFGRSGTTPGTYTASGFVRDSDGNGIDSVILGFSGGFGTATTDYDGRWLKNGLRGTVTVTPRKTGYVFTPSNREISRPTSSVSFVGSSDAAARGKLKVSLMGSTEPRVRSRVALSDLTPFDPEVYAPPFNSEAKGNLAGRYTPHSVIGTIHGMGVASPNYRLPLECLYTVAEGPYSGVILLPAFDFAFAKGIMYVDYLLEHGRYDFTVVEMEIWGENMSLERTDGFSILSEVHVDLGDEYCDVSFPKELRGKSHGTVHVFQLVDLIPLGKRDHIALVRLSFDHAVDRPYIVNPDGSYVHDLNPYFWECDTRMGLAGYVIYLPGLDLDLSSESAHLIFDWDLFDLIEVYDNGTPDDVSDDLITLRLDNPFPITLRAEPYEELEPIIGDGVQPPEVSELDILFFDLVEQQVAIRWINPPTADFRQVHIVRKESVPPTGIEDGDVIYVGSGYMYQDDDIKLGKEYFYRVIVEDWDGLLSDGKTISIRTDPWEFTSIRAHAVQQSVSVGEMVRLWADGYTTPGERRRAVCRWELDGDVGGLTYDWRNYSTVLDEPGYNCDFKATKPGVGVVTATWGDLSDSVTITVTE
jgi:hypothetical protein